MIPRWTLLWLPGLALACAAALLALEAPGSERLAGAAFAAIGVLLPWGVALAVRARYPQRPLARLLFALAAVSGAQTLVASQDAALFTLARAARPAAEVMLLWVMLAFPSGRVEARVDRWLLGAAAASVFLLWVPGMMFSPRIPLAGPYVACGVDCPSSILFVSDRPDLARAFLGAFRIVAVLALLGTALRLAWRFRQSSDLMRRAFAPVVIASIARLASVALFLATGAFTWALALSFWAVPAAIALGLLRGRLWIARALQQLVAGQRVVPDRHALRDLIARALGDPSLQVGYWVPDDARWVDADDQELQLPSPADASRAARMIPGDVGEASVVLVHDAALLEEPSLVEAVASSMRLALTTHQLDAALRTSRKDRAAAVELERRRIERDLHDGAQQRLIALRMKVAVAQRLVGTDPQRAVSLLDEIGPDIEFALKELRELAHGIVPAVLVEQGLAPALQQVARRFMRPIEVDAEPVGLLDAAVERAVYFCCVEALQNAAKHAGQEASVRLSLRRQAQVLTFLVEDDGPGMPALPAAAGRGLDNMHQRLQDVGGQLSICDRAEGGLRVEGSVPLR